MIDVIIPTMWMAKTTLDAIQKYCKNQNKLCQKLNCLTTIEKPFSIHFMSHVFESKWNSLIDSRKWHQSHLQYLMILPFFSPNPPNLVFQLWVLDLCTANLVWLGRDNCCEVPKVSEAMLHTIRIIWTPENQWVNIFRNVCLECTTGIISTNGMQFILKYILLHIL